MEKSTLFTNEIIIITKVSNNNFTYLILLLKTVCPVFKFELSSITTYSSRKWFSFVLFDKILAHSQVEVIGKSFAFSLKSLYSTSISSPFVLYFFFSSIFFVKKGPICLNGFCFKRWLRITRLFDFI